MVRMVKEAIYLCVISVLIGFVVNTFSTNPLPLIRPPDERIGKWPVRTAEEILEHMQDGTAILLDAREANYFQEGHIPGAVNVPATQFGEVFAEVGEGLPREFPIIVYCQGGPCDESRDVLDHLELLGFLTLSIYEGGWMDWETKQFPVEKNEEPSEN